MIHLFHWISRWASRHARLAIALIVLFEVINGFNGVLLGATLLVDVPTAGLYGYVAVLMGLAVGVRWLYRTGPDRYGFGRMCLFGAFLGNFLLFGLLGGLIAPRPASRDVLTGAWGNRRIDMRSDSPVRSDTLRPAEPPTAVANAGPAKNKNGKKAGFVALFVLSIFLMLYMAGLACSIACAGYGFLAAVVFLLGLGFPAGGIYFLGRATDQPFKTRREMTPAERRRTGRRFWLSWGLLAGIVTLLLLISAVASQ